MRKNPAGVLHLLEPAITGTPIGNIIDAMSKDAVYLLIELVKHQGART